MELSSGGVVQGWHEGDCMKELHVSDDVFSCRHEKCRCCHYLIAHLM